MIVGRWRAGRSIDEYESLNPSNDDLFSFFDMNNDHFISAKEFNQRMTFKMSDKLHHSTS